MGQADIKGDAISGSPLFIVVSLMVERGAGFFQSAVNRSRSASLAV